MLSAKHGMGMILREVMLLFVAIIATYIVSAILAPWYITADLASGVGQTGWPLAYWMKMWADLGNNKGYEQSTFNFLSLAVDIGLFYLTTRLLVFRFTKNDRKQV